MHCMRTRLALAALVTLVSPSLLGQSLLGNLHRATATTPSSIEFFVADTTSQHLFFAAADSLTGSELWMSDGTEAGTRRVEDLAPGLADSGPRWITACFGGVAYVVDDNTSTNTIRRYKLRWTDGTAANSFDLAPGPLQPTIRPELLAGKLYFVVQTPVRDFQVWCSDGTPAGTGPLSPEVFRTIPRDFIESAGVAYFVAPDSTFRRRLFRTDGTSAGTVEVAPAADYTIGLQVPIVSVGGLLYFATQTGLWRTDGSAAGTLQVRELDSVGLLAALGQQVVFRASDTASGLEPWISDGTAGGTRLLLDLWPGPDSGLRSNFTGFVTDPVRNRVLFLATEGTLGDELWASDGTAAGTRLVKDIRPGPEGSRPFGFFTSTLSLIHISEPTRPY